MRSLARTSPIQTLILDQPENNPVEITALIQVPVALKCLSINQEISCFSIGSCWHPLYKLYGESIRVHKDTLENLDLDIRRHSCGSPGHAFNPNAQLADKMDMYRDNPDEWKDTHLIGSLRDFKALKSLSVDVSALCGDHQWGVAPYQLREILPETLETLKLYVTMVQTALSRPLEFQNKAGWLYQLIEMVKKAERDHPKLKELVLLIHGAALPDIKDGPWFTELRESCKVARIQFREEIAPDGSRVPWFREVQGTWNPGRDF
jgi:hypothetical protein